MPPGAFNVETLGAPQDQVAYRLRAVREAMGLSLREFTKLLTRSGRHVSHTAVMKYERGQLKITPDYVDQVSAATGVPFGWFLSGLTSDDSPDSGPAIHAAGLGFLPPYLHASVCSRLEGLADWCAVPPGPSLDEFYAHVGEIIRGPFRLSDQFIRPLDDLTERELSVYVATQFANLRTLLRRLGDLPGPEVGDGLHESGEGFVNEAGSPASDAAGTPVG